jgi:aspartate-semialdehyde dehydrogenase
MDMESNAFAIRRRMDVGVLGATGMVGQQFICQLAAHPWFRPAWLAASERSEGRTYKEAASWRLPEDPPADIAGVKVEACVPGRGPRLIFSALDANAAKDLEPAFARAGHIVITNARSFRMDPSVPLLIPEINGEHLALMPKQRKDHAWPGAIVTNPNCSTIALAMVLAPLRQFGLRAVNVTTLQAVSGAGYPGVPSMDIIGNVVPFIGGEEEKIESETQKILGSLDGDAVTPHLVVVSAHTTRVPVIDGHTLMASIKLDDSPSVDEVREALSSWKGRPQELGLPSAPPSPIVCLEQPDRPQPRRDALRDGGMTVSVGRIRPCPVLGTKLAALGHNTIRGAAGAAVLNAELMVADGWVEAD